MRGRFPKIAPALLLLLFFASQSFAAEAIEVFVGEKRVAIPVVAFQGRQYLPLDQMAKALQARYHDLSGKKVRIWLRDSSFLLREGSPKVVRGEEGISLSASPLLLKSGWVVPIDLFSFLLREKYGEGVWWDKDNRCVRVGQGAYSVRTLRYRSYSDHTRVVVELTLPLDFSWREETDRVLLLLQRGCLSPTIKKKEIIDGGGGLIRVIEARQGPDFSEIELSGLNPQRAIKVFALKSPHRVVIDVYNKGDKVEETKPSREEKVKTSTAAVQPSPLKLVIDPGHGGKDSGAVGPTGLKEKDVVLDIGLRVRDLVEKNLGMEVVMTRRDDTFIPLRERATIANTAKGDFFLSVHANASLRGKAEGFETFFLSYEASDSEAREAAIRENNVIEGEGVNPRSAADLKVILWDMAQNEYINESSRLAEIIQNGLDEVQKAGNRGIKTAPFYVLMGAAMPAVLVEVAFISNPEGERKLNDDAYRQTLCEALFRAISEFKGHFEKKMGMARGTKSS